VWIFIRNLEVLGVKNEVFGAESNGRDIPSTMLLPEMLILHFVGQCSKQKSCISTDFPQSGE
jgi:hypothetical protein